MSRTEHPTVAPRDDLRRPGRTFHDDETLLAGVLAEVVRSGEGDDAMDLHERAVALAQRARTGDAEAGTALSDLVADLAVEEAEILVRSLTSWFQLVNLAEDNERIRRLHARELAQAPAPRAGSLRDAIQQLAAKGAGADDLRSLLARAEVRLVLTAHPTEARRRTTLGKLARLFTYLRDLDERPGLPEAEGEARRLLLSTVQALWGSDELRAVSPTVIDEVRAGLVYFVSTIADAIPRLYRELEAALAESYPDERFEIPPLLTYGSWIGGDRDGNPYVTPEVTVEALGLMRDQCLRFLEGRLELLAGRVSFSERVSGRVPGLDDLLADGTRRFPEVALRLARVNAEEPYRRAFSLLAERIRATRAGTADRFDSPGQLLADLRLIERCLVKGPGPLTAAGDLRDVIRQVEVFGFHFARLDIREHANRHRDALTEIFAELDVRAGYSELPEAERIELLCSEIASHRPLIPSDVSGFSDGTRQLLDTFRMLREQLAGEHRGAVEAYVVSGTEGPVDLLEVLLLMKEAGMTRAGGHEALLRVVPLFEAGATLDGAAETLRTLISKPVYRAALKAVGDEQEVMVGYSDSNKDVGYLASSWATYRAQLEMVEVLRAEGLNWVFFHGRGGAVGRGGGPTNVAIMALPPGTVEGRLKMTEQGEVLAAKYAVGEIAHRELELTASAVLASALDRGDRESEQRRERYETLLDSMARRSARAYRELIHEDPDFVRCFTAVTPVNEISRLRLGSRPAKRTPDGGIDDLRAIPWVFSWTQARVVLPAWFGLGTALAEAREAGELELLREMESEWPFFAAVLSNAEMACAKADPAIARRYFELWDEEEPRERIWGIVGGELERTRSELTEICGEQRLLDREPVLQASIDRRNPYVDPLSFVQIELLRRLRRGDRAATADLERAALLAVNGIAGGLRNTG